MNEELLSLKNCLSHTPQIDYPVHSRIHLLRSFNTPFSRCYVKRDDELGFGISGSKIRKYRSLVPSLIANEIQEVVVIGSAYSNHILSLTQLLIENGLQPTLFLRGDPDRPHQGNALLTSLFISPHSIHWFSQSDWKNVEEAAQTYALGKKHPTLVLPEGGFHPWSLPGALTLPLDLLQNEQKNTIQFDHIFIEAGTGFTASALLLGLDWLKHPAHIHIVLLAEDKEAFLIRLKACHAIFSQLLKREISFPSNFSLYLPLLTRGFGQINASLFENIKQIARTEGFLTDPVYSTKLFIESKQLIKQEQITGNILIHHSGGGLTLMGFQNQLASSQRNLP